MNKGELLENRSDMDWVNRTEDRYKPKTKPSSDEFIKNGGYYTILKSCKFLQHKKACES